jgi:hypothetical protein
VGDSVTLENSISQNGHNAMPTPKQAILDVAPAKPETFEQLVETVHANHPELVLTDIRGGIWSLLAGGMLQRNHKGLLVRRK